MNGWQPESLEADLPRSLRTVASRALATGQLVVSGPSRSEVAVSAGIPMRVKGDPFGALVLSLPPGRSLDDSGVSVMEVLANQVAVAIENAQLFQESVRLRSRLAAALAETARHARELEDRDRQLERARMVFVEAQQRELIGHERNRIARELHDTVAQYLIGIGMNLEWCPPRLSPLPPPRGRE